MLEAYGEDFPFDEFDKQASDLFHAKYDGGRLPIKSGVREILDYLKSSNKKIALATSTKKTSVIRRLSEAGLLEYFDEIVTGDMVTHSKPHPEIYLFACEKIGVKPEDAYAIEDSYNGIRSATSGGLRTIMVPDLLPANDEMHELAETILNDLNEVIEYLDKM
jgi:HAD superfamily hydrolase (TIGR01509 family)